MRLSTFGIEFGTRVGRAKPFFMPNFSFGMGFGKRVDLLSVVSYEKKLWDQEFQLSHQEPFFAK